MTCSYITTEIRTIESTLSGRELFVSGDPLKWAIRPDVTATELSASGAAFLQWTEENASQHRSSKRRKDGTLVVRTVYGGFSHSDRLRFAETVATESADELAAGLDEFMGWLVGEPGAPRRTGLKKSLLEALILLWREDVICAPTAEVISWPNQPQTIDGRALAKVDTELWGPEDSTRLENALPPQAEAKRAWRTMPLCVGHFESILDLDPDVLSLLIHASGTRGRSVHAISAAKAVQDAQRHLLQDDPRVDLVVPPDTSTIRLSASTDVGGGPRSPRSDPDFEWARNHEVGRVKRWAEAAAEFVKSRTNVAQLVRVVRRINWLLDYVIAYEDVPADPIEFCRVPFSPAVDLLEHMTTKQGPSSEWSDYHIRMLKEAHGFFAWLLSQSAEVGDALQSFRNPVPIRELPSWGYKRPGQSVRQAIPKKIVKLLQEILREGDDEGPYAWGRTQQRDWFHVMDHETGEYERVWSPVRNHFFLLRLLVPLRGIQWRMLDSGEADEWWFNGLDAGTVWTQNSCRHAQEGRRAGVFREIQDSETGRSLVGLSVNTNKTQDKADDYETTGYVIPWQNDEVLRLLREVRDFQIRYNPVEQGVRRDELAESNLRSSRDVGEKMGPIYFLFRDLGSKYKDQPIRDSTLRRFWGLLFLEAEQRLWDSGERNADGSRITLVRLRHGTGPGTGRGARYTPLIDPHSIRVTGLTRLLEAGVPLSILSVFVAGHSTILMTLYYDKRTEGMIHEALTEASLQLEEGLLEDWRRWLDGATEQSIPEVLAYTSPDGLPFVLRNESGLHSVLDYGVCPLGGTGCDEGGPEIPGKKSKKRSHGPVIGGPRNCANCRFFITGPAFLGGLVAKFNETTGKIRELLYTIQEQTARRDELWQAKTDCRDAGVPFHQKRELDRLEEALEENEKRITEDQLTLTNLWRLIEQCRGILQRRREGALDDSASVALVTNTTNVDDIQIGIEEVSEYRLITRIVESAEIYPSVDTKLPALRRAKLYDTMFALNGEAPVFVFLDDNEIIEVGNEVARLLRAKVGERGVDDVVLGRKSLDELGLTEDLAQLIRDRVPTSHRIDGSGGRVLLPELKGQQRGDRV